jgi:ElaB/YqjD/DUF883 family membrane-anchored ribosome-binding protein
VAQERNPVDNANETDEIKHEIERTRVEMSQTIGEIQERLSPDHLMQQAKDGMKEAAAEKARSIMSSAGETAATVAYQARGMGDSLTSYIRQHPVQVALTVGAFTWWMLRSRDDSQDWYGTSETSWEDEDAMSFGDNRSLRNRVGEYASTARETVGEYASTARETVGEYASTARETAGEYAGAARERARRAAERARDAASSARSSANDFAQENPLAVGAIALAAGIAIGLAVPATEAENRTMGEARDRAWERATQAAADIKENVTKKVETVAENFVNENVIDTLTGSSREPMGRA